MDITKEKLFIRYWSHNNTCHIEYDRYLTVDEEVKNARIWRFPKVIRDDGKQFLVTQVSVRPTAIDFFDETDREWKKTWGKVKKIQVPKSAEGSTYVYNDYIANTIEIEYYD